MVSSLRLSHDRASAASQRRAYFWPKSAAGVLLAIVCVLRIACFAYAPLPVIVGLQPPLFMKLYRNPKYNHIKEGRLLRRVRGGGDPSWKESIIICFACQSRAEDDMSMGMTNNGDTVFSIGKHSGRSFQDAARMRRGMWFGPRRTLTVKPQATDCMRCQVGPKHKGAARSVMAVCLQEQNII